MLGAWADIIACGYIGYMEMNNLHIDCTYHGNVDERTVYQHIEVENQSPPFPDNIFKRIFSNENV